MLLVQIKLKSRNKCKIDNYLKFVNHICDLISMKIEEHEASKIAVEKWI